MYFFYFRISEKDKLKAAVVHNRQKNTEKMDLDEMAEMLRNFATSGNNVKNTNQPQKSLLNSQQQLQRKFSGGFRGSLEKLSTVSGGNASTNNPFETINQERLKPSRVEVIQHMFEKSGTSTNSNK